MSLSNYTRSQETEGLKTYKWHGTSHVILGRCAGDPHHCVEVHPDFKIRAGTFFIEDPQTGISREITESDIKNPQPKCEVYWAECEICPDRPRQAWGTQNIRLNGQILYECGVFDHLQGCEQWQIARYLRAGGNIELVYPKKA